MPEIITFFENTPAAFRMIFVKGGVFDIGGESGYDDSLPIHPVELSDYWIGEFPVTQAVWKKIVDNNPAFFKGGNRPVEQVSWEDIVNKFLPIMNRQTKDKRPINHHFRLPTEAEWEFAARGGTHLENQKKQPFLYAGGNKLEEVGWFDENSYGERKPVGLKLPNELGLFDMSGNVLEWCYDWFDDNYYKTCIEKGIVFNPKGSEEGTGRVLRGGSWVLNSQLCRTTCRLNYRPDDRDYYIGFRLVCSSLSL